MSDGFNVIVDAGLMQDYINTLQSIVNEATFHFDADGIKAEPLDAANVAAVNTHLHPEACEHYSTDGYRIGINLERFSEFLSAADAGELAELTLNPESRRIEIELPNTSFEMSGIDPDSVRQGQDVDDVPSLNEENLVIDVELDAAALKHAVSVVDMVSDHMEVSGNPDWDDPLHFIAEGDTDKASVEFGNSLHEGSQVREPASSLFSLDYVKDLSGAIPKDATVRMRVGDEWPTRWDYSFEDGGVDVTMMCAPRIQSR